MKLPNFWERLFCRHEWEEINGEIIFKGVKEMKANLPSKRYRRFLCRKCLKIKKIET